MSDTFSIKVKKDEFIELTIAEIEAIQVETWGILHARSYIFDNPHEYIDELHCELFTDEEKINLSNSMREL